MSIPSFNPNYPTPYRAQAASGFVSSTFATPAGYGATTVSSTAPVRMGGAAGAAMLSGHLSNASRIGSRVGSRAMMAGEMGAGWGKALGISALITAPLVALTDYMAFRSGKITAAQRNTLIAADTAGYVAAGAAGSWVGGALAGSFLGPVGTIVGLAAGVGLGYLYERYLRPNFSTSTVYPEPV
jgi:hypothetical protein